ncbi:fungal-specific transcription factor domain-containing protein [Xylogone sp. PMI_703]|nr:fungal-specific transcription factor domain-containing protein [Xylogone sp. PMI_703]
MSPLTTTSLNEVFYGIDIGMSFPLGTPPRISSACVRCRKRKVKCSGTQPCQNCRRHKLDCDFEEILKRKTYPISYVDSLIEKIKQQDKELGQYRQNADNSTELLLQSSQSSSKLTEEETYSSESHNHPDQFVRSPRLLPDQSLGKHIHNLVQSEAPGNNFMQPEPKDKAYSDVPWSTTSSKSTPIVVDEQEANEYLEIFISNIGDAYHFFDQRLFLDNLVSFYQLPPNSRDLNSLWYVQLLLVIAIGQLFSRTSEHATRPPGISYFLEAKWLLLNIITLREEAVQGAEILSLMAFYLQCCDQIEDAYVAIGSALRLALTRGMCENQKRSSAARSEVIHQTRLWWTIYILDRRIAAAIGCPPGIDDQHIEIEMPATSIGFPSPAALNVNIQITRIVGRIMASLYNRKITSKETIVSELQSILKSLSDVNGTIPQEYTVNFDKDLDDISRTGATLYLFYFQAIILAIRPTLFHLLKRKIREIKGDIVPPQRCPVEIVRLTGICRDAATKILKILRALKSKDIVSIFGFSDLDAAFSASFVFIIDSIISGSDRTRRPTKVDDLYNIIHHLVMAGNEVAANRESHISEICSFIWPSPSLNEEALARHIDTGPLQNSIIAPESHNSDYNSQIQGLRINFSTEAVESQPTQHANVLQGLLSQRQPAHNFRETLDQYYSQNSLHPDILFTDDSLLDLYYSQDVVLTGVDSLDWSELGRLAQDFEEP